MIVSGIGSITLKGLEIFGYCKTNDVAIEFKEFYVTNNNVALSSLTDPSDATYKNMTKQELENLLDGAGKEYYSGNVSGANTLLTQDDSTILPLLMTVISNAIEQDISLYTAFIIAKDSQGFCASVSTTTGFSTGHTVTDTTTSATGTIGFVDTVNNKIYIKSVSPSPVSANTFGVGNTIQDGTSSATASVSALNDADYVVQKTCLSMDERVIVPVADASSFSTVAPNNEISSANGASGIVTAINGNLLTVNRVNIKNFVRGDAVDNTAVYVATATTVASAVYVDVATTAVMPISYISNGSDILLRISIRYSSGMPRNLSFLNSAIVELEEHDSSDSSHIDIRLEQALYTAIVARSARENKYQIDALKSEV